MAKSIAEALEEIKIVGKNYLQIAQSIESALNISENAEFLITKNYGGDSNKTRIDVNLADRGKSFYLIIEKNYGGDANKTKITKVVE